MIYKAENKVQELFDKATERRMKTDGRPPEVFGDRKFAEIGNSMHFMFNNGKVLIKQSVYKSDDPKEDELNLYRNLCEFL